MKHYFAFLSVLMEFVGILCEPRKLFLRNKKLILFVILFPLFLHSIIYLFNAFSVKPLLTDVFVKGSFLLVTSPDTPEFASLLLACREIKFILGSECIFFTISSITSLFFAIAIVHASALTCNRRSLSIQDLLLLFIKSLKRPFITRSYITLFNLGYYFLLLMTLFPISLFAQTSFALRIVTYTLLVLASVFESYLAIVWNLSLVVSVLEEICGIEAFGKAAQIVKGTKLHLFILKLLCAVLYWVLAQGLRLIDMKQQLVFQIIIGLLVVDSIFLVRMFVHMAYTVFYFHCKKIHGEEVELQANVEYTEIPFSAPLIGEDIL